MEYLFQPPSLAPHAPTHLWLVLHGAAATAHQSLTLFGPAARQLGAAVLAPQATRALHDGFSWEFARNQQQITTLLDPPRLPIRTEATRLGLCGFSMGCTMGLWLLAHHPHRFHFCAMIGMGSAFEAWAFDDGGIPRDGLRAAARTTPLFLAVDQYDPAGCANYYDANLRILRELGFHVTTCTPAEGQHWVTPFIRAQLQTWVETLPEQGSHTHHAAQPITGGDP